MFDFAFSELLMIMLVALVVIGPERLPKVARTAGNLWGRAQRYVRNVKNDIANDLAIQEAKQMSGSLGKEVASVEQNMLDARAALDQKILEAQLGFTQDEHDDSAAARATNGHGEATPDDETRHARFPLPNPPPEGEGANVSLREFHVKPDQTA